LVFVVAAATAKKHNSLASLPSPVVGIVCINKYPSFPPPVAAVAAAVETQINNTPKS
jgi:hypothetical protein